MRELVLKLVNDPEGFFRRHGVATERDRAIFWRERAYLLTRLERRSHPPRVQSLRPSEDIGGLYLETPRGKLIPLEGPEARAQEEADLRAEEQRLLGKSASDQRTAAIAKALQQNMPRLSRLTALSLARLISKTTTKGLTQALRTGLPSEAVQPLYDRVRQEEGGLEHRIVKRCPSPVCGVPGGRFFVPIRPHEVYCRTCRALGKYRLWRLRTGRTQSLQRGRPKKTPQTEILVARLRALDRELA